LALIAFFFSIFFVLYIAGRTPRTGGNELNTTSKSTFSSYLFTKISKTLINTNNLDEVQSIRHQLLTSYMENLLKIIVSDEMTQVEQNQDIRCLELIQRPDNTRVT
jgi:hypothetical protein